MVKGMEANSAPNLPGNRIAEIARLRKQCSFKENIIDFNFIFLLKTYLRWRKIS